MSVLMNGFSFFLQYATQWGIFLTIVSFVFVWHVTLLELSVQRKNASLIQDPNNFTYFAKRILAKIL